MLQCARLGFNLKAIVGVQPPYCFLKTNPSRTFQDISTQCLGTERMSVLQATRTLIGGSGRSSVTSGKIAVQCHPEYQTFRVSFLSTSPLISLGGAVQSLRSQCMQEALFRRGPMNGSTTAIATPRLKMKFRLRTEKSGLAKCPETDSSIDPFVVQDHKEPIGQCHMLRS